jgi:cytochrome c peroxidase
MARPLQYLQAMLRSRGVKLGGLLSALALAGCWSETLDDGVFSPDQWAKLQADLAPMPAVDGCPNGISRTDNCDGLAAFGRKLFFDKALSEFRCLPDAGPAPCTPRPATVSCATCHDPKNWFIDSRDPNNVSLGATGFTKRNSPTLVDAAMKESLAPQEPVFTWIGTYSSAGDVLELAITKAMSTTDPNLATTIRDDYFADYANEWGQLTVDDAIVFKNTALSLDAYMRRLLSTNAPFDRYLAGDASAISDSAKRGFAVFVGPGGCLDCHDGPLFSDLQFHNTGVPQVGVADTGRDNQGTFLTPSLRQVAKTAPYMHDGVFGSLGEVIEFYRRGGDQAGFPKDPRLVPLDITDADALDLEAFLGALTGDPVPADQMCAVPPCS